MVTTRSGSKSSKIKLPLVGSVSYLAAAAGVAVIYYLWQQPKWSGIGPAPRGWFEAS